MRILLDYRPALRQRTGVGAYIHETALALAASSPAGESVVLFSASWKDRLSPDVIRALTRVDRRVPVQLLNFSWHRLGLPPVEWLAGGNFDVVQSAHPLLMPSRTAARVVTVHDLDFLDHPERTHGEIRRDYPLLAERHVRSADQVIAVSPDTARQVEARFDVPTTHITVCPPGAPDWAPREALPHRDGCILFVGTLEPRKNLDVLLDAYARLLTHSAATPPLVLAGKVDRTAAGLLERVSRAPFLGRVELTGYVDDTRKRALFDRATVFVLPSHTEGFGLPVLEAMAAGVPVVAANSGALPQTLGDAGERFEPADAEGLAHLLETIVASPDRQRVMAEAGYRQAARFTWAHTASRTREAWRLALEHRNSRV